VLRGAVTFFWLLFLADGAFSLFDEATTLALGSSPLSGVRAAFALAVLAMTIPMAAIIGVTPKAPKRVLVPLILFAWWAGPAMAFPFGLWKPAHLAFVLAWLQVLLALAVWYFAPNLSGTRRTLSTAVTGAQAFSWKYVLVAAPVTALLFLLVAAGSVALGFSTQIEVLTGGYVRIRPDGIYLVERQFHLGDREVRLAGMMHVARREFYSGVLPPPDPAESSVVLVEGVTDRKRLLGGRTLDYGRLAKLLNVTSQSESVFSNRVSDEMAKQGSASGTVGQPIVAKEVGIYYKHADVDVESFHPQTVAFILAVIAIFQSNDLREIVERLADPSSPIADEEAQEQVMDDILFSRNQRLVAEIESSLKDYHRVVVPWGAMHLPEIESWLRDHDFVQSGEVHRKALGFW
jgi:hypothetical protein